MVLESDWTESIYGVCDQLLEPFDTTSICAFWKVSIFYFTAVT